MGLTALSDRIVTPVHIHSCLITRCGHYFDKFILREFPFISCSGTLPLHWEHINV